MAINNDRTDDLNEEVLTKMNQAKNVSFVSRNYILAKIKQQPEKCCWIGAKRLGSLQFGGSAQRECFSLFEKEKNTIPDCPCLSSSPGRSKVCFAYSNVRLMCVHACVCVCAHLRASGSSISLSLSFNRMSCRIDVSVIPRRPKSRSASSPQLSPRDTITSTYYFTNNNNKSTFPSVLLRTFYHLERAGNSPGGVKKNWKIPMKMGMECFIRTLRFPGWTKKRKIEGRKNKVIFKKRSRKIVFFLEMVSAVCFSKSPRGILTQLPAAPPDRWRRRGINSSRPPLFNPDRPRGFLTKFIKAFVGHFLSFFVITFFVSLN